MKLLAPALAVLAFAGFIAAPAHAQTALATTNVPVTIATGNTFQTILAALGAPPAERLSITIENNNTNGDNCWLYVGSGSPTTATSMLLGTGGSYQRYYPYVPSDPIKATCATTNDTLYLDTQ